MCGSDVENNTVHKEDRQILEGLRSGREDAFRQLFEMYYQNLFIFAGKYLNDPEAARDTVQDFFLNLYETRASLHIHSSVKSYLYSSVRNRCLNRLKYERMRVRHRDEVLQEEIIRDPGPEEKMKETELEAMIHTIVTGLPEQCRRIYIMSRVDGAKNMEIASELNLSVRTVETQISKALKVLREKLSRLDLQ